MDCGLPLNPNEGPNSDRLNITSVDLPSAIILLDDLASAAEATLRSVSALLSPSSSASSPLELFSGYDNALSCPYDFRHRMPPEHLFRHSLRCPSAPGASIPDLSFLDGARYPESVKAEAELGRENTNRFSSPEPGAADLCLSLDGELGDVTSGGVGFFYGDCPGVVSFPEMDASRSIFNLPRILFMLCDDFNRCLDGENVDLARGSAKILPSELWALRLEVSAWVECPSSYSFAVLRAISCLDTLEEQTLRDWLISASCRHGILLDCAMRDHVFVLLKLCLKASWSEAATALGKHSTESQQTELRFLCFDCPCLSGSMSWLASILSILYGDASAKNFSVDMLKEAVLQSGSKSLIYRNNVEVADGCKEGYEGHKGKEAVKIYGPRMCRSPVFVSQVAAAVTALHERSSIETKIRNFRFPQPHNKTQILIEHSETSTRANEERSRRSNYRAVIEHDGIIGQPSSNKDQNKPKTKEELLAEERDYKRRRMSYRGKKNKRNPNQVLHDIIEEHMEEIRRAGGITSPIKVSVDAGLEELEPGSQGGSINSYINESRSPSLTKRIYKDDDRSYRKDSHNLEVTCTSYRLRDHDEGNYGYNQSPGEENRRTLVCDEGENNYKSRRHPDDRLRRHNIHETYERSGGKNKRSDYSKRSAEYRRSSHGRTASRERHFEGFSPEDNGHSSFKDRYAPSSSSDIYDSYNTYASKCRYEKSNGQKDEHHRDLLDKHATKKHDLHQ